MVALPSLRPNAPVTNVSITVVGAATGWEAIDDDPDAPNTADYVYDAGTTSGDLIVGLTDMPEYFQSMQSPLTVRAVTQAVGFADDSDTLTVELTDANGVSWSNTVTLSTQAHTAQALRTASLTLNATALAASKAAWDNARLRMLWTYSASMAKDNGVIRVYALEVDGNYIQQSLNRTGTISQSVGAVTQAATGDWTDPVDSGAISQTLAGVTQVATGTFREWTGTGAIAQTLQPVSQGAAGTWQDPVDSGAIAQSVAAVTQSGVGVHNPPAAATPTNLVGTSVGGDQVDLTWDAIPDVDGYDIERDGEIIVVNHPTNSYSDTNVVGSTQYTYRVRAVA